MVHNLMNARKKARVDSWSRSRKLWTVQLKTARSYPESQQLSQISGEPETSLFLLSAEVITGLLMIDLKPAAALKAD